MPPSPVKKDSLASGTVRRDTALRRPATAVRDSATTKKSIPKRILTFKEQLFYALIFMSYLATMMFVTNFNP